MKIEYAVFILLLYFFLVLAGIWLCGFLDKQKSYRRPVRIPLLSDREKRGRLNELLAPYGFAYDRKQNIFYSRTDAWQRRWGYGRPYDEGAACLGMILDCEPIYFEYDGKLWLIEFWKGQYGIATGGEVGVYELPKTELAGERLLPDVMFRCVGDEDVLRIKTALFKRGVRLFYRKGYHWWLTGFAPGVFSKPKELEMDIEITLKNMEMRDAFLQGLHRAGYENGELSVQGTTVWVHFRRPHTEQPMTRTRLFSMVKQWENRFGCRVYRRVTKDYANAYDKLLAVKERAPELYEELYFLGNGKIQKRGRDCE